MVWFFRVAMGAAGEWMTLNVPKEALGYELLSGLIEMAALGALYGLALSPPESAKAVPGGALKSSPNRLIVANMH